MQRTVVTIREGQGSDIATNLSSDLFSHKINENHGLNPLNLSVPF